MASKRMVLQEDLGYLNAMEYAISSSDFNGTTLAAAIAAAAGAKKIIYLAVAAWTITANLSIPANIIVWAPSGTSIVVSNGVTLTFATYPRLDHPGVFASTGTIHFLAPPGGPGAAINVTDFRAAGDGTTDDTLALQAALDLANTNGGGVVFLPAGIYRTTSPLIVYPSTTIRGEGRKISTIRPDHTGDGLYSHSPINIGSTAIHITLRDMGIDKYGTAAAGTGSGYADVAGAFLRFDNVFIRDCAFQLIFDQTEHVLVTQSEFITLGPEVGVWLVNGPDHTATASPMFTNLITIEDSQFNSLIGSDSTHILDDGGINHAFLRNNFNAGATGVVASNIEGLIVEGNFFESQTTEALTLADLTRTGGNMYLHNMSPAIRNNVFSTTFGSYHISIVNAYSGEVTDNHYIGNNTTVAFLRLQDDDIQGILIEGNTKFPPILGSEQVPVMATTALHLTAQRYRQRMFTSQLLSATAGSDVEINPRDMGIVGTLERPRVGDRVLIADTPTYTSPILGAREITIVKTVQEFFFTVDLVNSYGANFGVFLLGDTSITESTGGINANPGTGSINNGATSTVVTHGITFASPPPVASDIVIVPINLPTNDIGHVWISNITSTSFQVNCEHDPGVASFAFAWRVNLPYRR